MDQTEQGDMDKQVTVIVPVYNAEEFLPECMDRILGQDYDNFELLLVDDGSTDNSRRICEAYAEKSTKIRFFHQNNSGVSAARNYALQQARGQFVVFADADDYLPQPDVLSCMVEKIEADDADLVVGDYFRLWNGRLLPAGSCAGLSTLSPEDGAFWFRGFFSVGTLSYIWGKMYRRSFLEQHELRFCDYRYGEDKLFNFECYIHGASYAFLGEPVYVYRKNDDSVSYSYRGDSAAGWLGIAGRTEELLREQGLEEKYADLVACTIFFAAFFDGKMNYVYGKRKLSAVRKVLREYGGEELARRCFIRLSGPGRLRAAASALWQVMIWGFACGMRFRCYTMLSLGIKMLIDLRIDERLSDTGLREE